MEITDEMLRRMIDKYNEEWKLQALEQLKTTQKNRKAKKRKKLLLQRLQIQSQKLKCC